MWRKLLIIMGTIQMRNEGRLGGCSKTVMGSSTV